MTDGALARTRPLGEIAPAGSRQRGRRSAVALTDGALLVGTAEGDIISFERNSSRERWRAALPGDGGSIVTLATTNETVVAGTRGPDGWVAAFEGDTGAERWRHRTADDVGEPTKDTRFFLPFVVDAVTAGDRTYVAARRYERRAADDAAPDTNDRHFESVVYAFEADGTVAWRYEADASPISLAARDDRLAVAYNRCPGEHGCGLVVLDRRTGALRADWDPGTDGDRRVGDVSLVPDGAVAASHGDYRGYALDRDGDVRWRVDLATPTDVGDERLYAYPNHVHATADGAVFLTGNTYPTEGREAEGRHPSEHTAVGVAPDGTRRWAAEIGGFAHGIAADGSRIAVPVAQHFRDRDPSGHALRVFAVADGRQHTVDAAGVVTAAALDSATAASVEEPVVYHDEGVEHGAYRLHVTGLSAGE
ncbi:outer membrane protein assembly factor BamB family protein [Halorientalis marina]|uniref:outer membrane protein assembly factor BamB family protein n=1 Tax=Halorientalis marina TaxID=2931976 RepID=UPI001FF2ABFC|nr:PQQ-binding-like beta-propeller repeat protein [Halorientalis marina]